MVIGRGAWLDGRRLRLQAANRRGAPRLRDVHNVIWHTVTNRLEPFVLELPVKDFCHSPITGIMAYRYRKPGQTAWTYLSGPPGRLRQETPPQGKRAFRNKHTCTWQTRPAWMEKSGLHFVPLMPGDGYLDVGKYGHSGARPVRHHTDAGGWGTIVPFTQMAAGAVGEAPRFYPFKGAYFVADNFARGKDAASCAPAWWFWPEGLRIERVCMPYAVKNIFVVPTRLGLVADHRNHDSLGNLNDSGLFLFADGRRIPLASGFVMTLIGSPDGCTIAFKTTSYRETISSPDKWWLTTMKAIDLCAHRQTILAIPE